MEKKTHKKKKKKGKKAYLCKSVIIINKIKDELHELMQ